MKTHKNITRDAEIRANLAEAIRTSGKTKKQIAIEVGISNTTLADYLHRGTSPSLTTFARLCEVLEVSADEILNVTFDNKN